MFSRDQFANAEQAYQQLNRTQNYAIEQNLHPMPSPTNSNAPYPPSGTQAFPPLQQTPASTVASGRHSSTFVTAPLAGPESRWWNSNNNVPGLTDQPLFDPSSIMGGHLPMFNIFNDPTRNHQFTPLLPTAAPPAPAPPLANGGCNFVDSGSKCGCRRFYSSHNPEKPNAHEFCMCSHHACFHDHEATLITTVPPTPVTRQLDTPQSLLPMGPPPVPFKPTQNATKTPLQDISDRFTSATSTLVSPMEASKPAQTASNETHAPQQTEAQTPSQPDTYNRFMSPTPTSNPDPNQNVMPSRDDMTIPDTQSYGGSTFNCLPSRSDSMSTNIAPPRNLAHLISPRPVSQQSISTTTSSKYMLPFGGKGLNLLNRGKRREPLQDRTEEIRAASAKERRLERGNRCDSRSTTCSISEISVPISKTPDTVVGLRDMINSHEARIDRLENTSIITNAHEECLDRYEGVDTRMCELENRLEDVEQKVNDSSLRRSDLGSSNDGLGRKDIIDQLQALQAQFDQFHQISPSPSHPWEIEVVFLPFHLRKVWGHETSYQSDHSNNPSDTDNWTQKPPKKYAAKAPNPSSPIVEDWTLEMENHDWLIPRVYRPDSVVYERLKSRGCIRTVSITGPDARAVQIAINNKFNTLLREIALRREPRSDQKVSKYAALQQDWIPLRRIQRDTRLRFLNKSEMVTPALWDVQFLHSVVMKSTVQRLFITQPESYIQDDAAYASGWDWQSLRELKRVYPDNPDSQEVREGDANEQCWEWHAILDLPSSSDSLRRSRRSTPANSVHNYIRSTGTSRHSSSPLFSRTQTPIRVTKPSRPAHVRTTSMPSAFAGPATSPVDARRRMLSQAAKPHSPIHSAFRHRTARSPSVAHAPTPRRSGSPSPAPTNHITGLVRSVSNASSKGSRSTGNYYATPYSNAMPPPPNIPMPRSQHHDEDDSYDNHIIGYEEVNVEDSFMTDADEDRESAFIEVSLNNSISISPENGHRDLMDIPWQGIEDQMSDSENIDPETGSRSTSRNSRGQASDSSSQPSEYPSTYPGGDFDIHEDEMIA